MEELWIDGLSYETRVRIKPNKVALRYYKNPTKEYAHSVVVPTDYHPLPDGEIEVYTANNTTPITDKKILDLLNKINFEMGKCYSISQQVYDVLKKNGYNPVILEGWMVLLVTTRLVHHCVVKLDDHIIDSSIDDSFIDEFKNLYSQNPSMSLEESRTLIADLYERDINKKTTEKYPNIGRLCNNAIFIGVPSTADDARNNYNRLMDMYPNHEDYNGNGMTRYGNRLNQIIAERGL